MDRLLTWDTVGERYYEVGVRRGVLFPMSGNSYGNGVAWSGLTGVSENPTGGEPTKIYADDINYLNLYSAEEFEGTITAYTYPKEFEACDGSLSPVPGVKIGQQERKAFGFVYRTSIGNDTDGNEKGYKLHFIYGAKCSPSSKDYKTINDSPEAIEFSWDITSTPVEVGKINDVEYKNTSHLIVSSLEVDEDELAALETIIYGTAATTGTDPQPEVKARLPLPAEIIGMFTATP